MQVVEQLKKTSPERFLEIYSALENQGFGPLDHEVAKALNFRPQAIRKLPMAQRARRALSILQAQSNAEMTYELFGSYLLKTNKDEQDLKDQAARNRKGKTVQTQTDVRPGRGRGRD